MTWQCPECDRPGFHCHHAPRGRDVCPDSICDCFRDLYPDDPFGLHPEAFIVQRPEP